MVDSGKITEGRPKKVFKNMCNNLGIEYGINTLHSIDRWIR